MNLGGGGGDGKGNFLDAHHFVSGCKWHIFELIRVFRLTCQYCIEPSGQNASSLKHTVHCTQEFLGGDVPLGPWNP